MLEKTRQFAMEGSTAFISRTSMNCIQSVSAAFLILTVVEANSPAMLGIIFGEFFSNAVYIYTK